MTEDARISPVRWAHDGETDSSVVPFDDPVLAETYVAERNRQEGRSRWTVLRTASEIPDRSDGTPALVPSAGRIWIAGSVPVGCADALEIAAACAHAAEGRRRRAAGVVVTAVDDEVVMEVSGHRREWRYARSAAGALAVRLGRLALEYIEAERGKA